MRIHASTATAFVAPPRTARGSGGPAFNLAESEAAHAAVPLTSPRAVAGLDALLALQTFDDPQEKRRRAVKRGRHALDALDELKIALLAGNLDSAALARLKAATAALPQSSGDVRIDSVLAEIELRAEVELAKFARRPAATG